MMTTIAKTSRSSSPKNHIHEKLGTVLVEIFSRSLQKCNKKWSWLNKVSDVVSTSVRFLNMIGLSFALRLVILNISNYHHLVQFMPGWF